MEIAAFVTGGIVALAGRAVLVSVTGSQSQSQEQEQEPPAPPQAPPPPPCAPKRAFRPKVLMHVRAMPTNIDLSQSYMGTDRCERDPEGASATVPASGLSQSAPSFTRDPDLINVARLRHVDAIARPCAPERNASEICRLLEAGKSRLRSVPSIPPKTVIN